MTTRLADNIISPLGFNTQQNYQAVKHGCSAVRRYENLWDMEEPFCAALFTEEQKEQISIDGLSLFESLAVRSITDAVNKTNLDISSKNVIFILSTTKANIGLAERNLDDDGIFSPANAAMHIAEHLKLANKPVVVCNACISGLAAIVLAQRMLEAEMADYAVVCGADLQSKFTVQGFHSLLALSQEPCRPFDIDRIGLNLGEAAATIILKRTDQDAKNDEKSWKIGLGAVKNDAYHISAPSKQGDGAREAMKIIIKNSQINEIGFINAHGTATLFNDQMEAVAIKANGMDALPVNALKGYFGHTLGAAGILETVISMAAADDNTIIATKGFNELGVSENIQVVKENTPLSRHAFIKMISGFGGGNAAVLATKRWYHNNATTKINLNVTHRVKMTDNSLEIDGKLIGCQEKGKAMLHELYKTHVNDYPKFYKMDPLAKLGFIAAELLLKKERTDDEHMEKYVEMPKENHSQSRAVILFNHSASVTADRKFIESMNQPDGCFPSPAVFVYTLPNIVTGEIAIRNGYHAETAFYVIDKQDNEIMSNIILTAFSDPDTLSAIAGWIDCTDPDRFVADLCIYEKEIVN